MDIFKKIGMLAFATTLVSCAATGPANDGFELSQESVDIGSLLGEEALTFRVDSVIDRQDDKLPAEKP